MSHVTHGGMREEELRALGIDPATVIDLSANLHPAGPDPRVVAAARSARLDRYPSVDAAPLRDEIAAVHDLHPSTILVTPGATAALHLVARALLRPGDTATISGPTFGEYRAAVLAAGSQPVEFCAGAPEFQPVLASLQQTPSRLIWLCQPNNPTGVHLGRDAVEALLRSLSPDQWLVIDAAYAPFVQDGWDPAQLVATGHRVIVVHSMTKLHAIPGLRLGYIVAAPEVVQRLQPLQPSWSIDAVSLAAGLVAARQHEARVALLEPVWRTRELLRQHCTRLGLTVTPGQANFLLVRTGHAATTRARLIHEGFLVRDCTSFGLPEWIRLATPADPDLPALTAALERASEVERPATS